MTPSEHTALLGVHFGLGNYPFPSLLWHLGGVEIPWCFSQVKGTIEDEVADGMYACVCVCVFMCVWKGKLV